MRTFRRRSLAAAALVLLLAEVFTRVVAEDLPSPIRWSNEEEQVKADDLAALSGRPGGVVFVGSSMMDAAADPAYFLQASGGSGPAYNAALLGAETRIMRLWLDRFVVPVVEPSLVVAGVSCREITEEAAQDDQYEQFVASPAMRSLAGRPTLLDRVDERLSWASALVRHRQELRQPLNLVGRDRRSNEDFDINPYGRDDHFLDRTYPAPEDVEKVLYNPDVETLDIDEDKVAALAALVRDLRRADTDVLVVNMPITQDFVGYMPEPSQDTNDRCWSLLRTTVEEAGGRYLEAGVWERRYFADPIHLNRTGSRRFTQLLAEALESEAGTASLGA